MEQLKQALLSHVQKHGPIVVKRHNSDLPAFVPKARELVRKFGGLPDPISIILRQLEGVRTPFELAPYALALLRLRPDLKWPKNELWDKAFELIQQLPTNAITDSDEAAPISPGYDIVPASDQARGERKIHNEKMGITYQPTASKRKRNPHTRPRFNLELGY